MWVKDLRVQRRRAEMLEVQEVGVGWMETEGEEDVGGWRCQEMEMEMEMARDGGEG